MTATPEEMLGAAMAALQSGGTGADAVLDALPAPVFTTYNEGRIT